MNVSTAYMLRRDGKLIKCKDIHPYIKNSYKDSFNSYKILTELDYGKSQDLIWLYRNTLSSEVKLLINNFLNYLFRWVKDLGENYESYLFLISNIAKDLKIDLKPTYCPPNDLPIMWDNLNNFLNEEFCKIRTSDEIYGGDSNDIYFRIGSTGFNWFPLIWRVVYDNRDWIESVTILTDENSGRNLKYFAINNEVIKQYDVEDFINLKGSPIIESYPSIPSDVLKGKLLIETINPKLHPLRINNIYKSALSFYTHCKFK